MGGWGGGTKEKKLQGRLRWLDELLRSQSLNDFLWSDNQLIGAEGRVRGGLLILGE